MDIDRFNSFDEQFIQDFMNMLGTCSNCGSKQITKKVNKVDSHFKILGTCNNCGRSEIVGEGNLPNEV